MVTDELDASGPIIEQERVRTATAGHKRDDYGCRLEKDVEKMLLSRGLRYHLEDRVLVHDKTRQWFFG